MYEHEAKAREAMAAETMPGRLTRPMIQADMRNMQADTRNMVGARDLAGGSPSTMAGGSCEAKDPAPSLDRRIERMIERTRERSQDGQRAFYEARQLEAFLECLPRRLPEAAAEGLRIILDRAGF